MSLAAQQNFWARYYTEPDLRERCRTEPEKVAAELGIGLEMVEQTVAQDGTGMGVFTSSLVRKRFKQVSSLLPATKAAMGDGFLREFEAYAAQNPLPDAHRYESDAVAFANRLSGRLEPALGEFLRFESTLARWRPRPPKLALAWFSYPVLKMAAASRRGNDLLDFAPRRTLVMTWKWAGEQYFRGFPS